jgi:L-ascorbate metabolism protein UlaG (beta-lactamase superfamily)
MPLTNAIQVGRRFMNPVPTSIGNFSTMLKVGPSFYFGASARSPQVPLGPFQTDHRIYSERSDSGLRVTWFGHSCSLVEIDGMRVLIDPIWDERASPLQWTGPKRFFQPPLALCDLPRLDAVIISHDHYDHLSAGTAQQLARLEKMAQTRWITPLGVGPILSRLGVGSAQIAELDWTEQVTVGSLTIAALPARHFSGRSLFNQYETLWASFALIGPKHRVYYGADSGEWPGFSEIGATFGPFDLTMLEIGASSPYWPEIHMGPEGAVRCFHALGGNGLLMPIHWGLFDLALHEWREPIKSVSVVEGLKLWSPTPGIPTEYVSGEEVRSNWWNGG